MNQEPLIRMSVVIPSFNGKHLLETCLPALTAELPEACEVLVVDNGSADGTVEWVTSQSDARIVPLSLNQGFAAACNAGARAARGRIVTFLNNDAIVTPGWAEPLLQAIESRDDTVIAGGLTLFADRPKIVNSAGTRLAPSAAGVDIGFGLPADELPIEPGAVAGVSGVSMAVDSTWFQGCGGFDEDFFMYFEDVDLCLRAWIAGYRVHFAPESVVHHAFGGSSGDRYTTIRNQYGSRNRILIAIKCFDGIAAPLAVALSVAQDVGVVSYLVAQGRWDTARSAAVGKLRGTLCAVREAPRTLSKRRLINQGRRRSVRDLKRLGVIDDFRASVTEYVRMRAVP